MAQHQCTVCGKTEEWNDQWQTYGSIQMQEDGAPLLFTCSEDCRARVPDPEQALADLWAQLEYHHHPQWPFKKAIKLSRKGNPRNPAWLAPPPTPPRIPSAPTSAQHP